MSLHLGPLAMDIRDGIRSRPGRMIAASATIAAGVAATVVLFALLGGLSERARRLAEMLGTETFAVVQPQMDPRVPHAQLSDRHLATIRACLPGCAATGIRRDSATPMGSGRPVCVLATDSACREVRGWPISAGRFLDDADVLRASRHAVVSRALSAEWNWTVGDVIVLGGTPFLIVGVVEPGAVVQDSELRSVDLMSDERCVLVPCTVTPSWDDKPAEGRLSGIFIKPAAASDLEGAAEVVRRLLSQPDCRADAAVIVTQRLLLDRVTRMQTATRLSVGTIAGLCLLLGGIMLMTLMTEDVRGRVAEIGLRRALGASRGDVAVLFTAEAVAVAAVSGAAGLAAGRLLLALAAPALPVPAHPGVSTLVVPLLATLCVGGVSAWWPARLASRIVPSEALRNE